MFWLIAIILIISLLYIYTKRSLTYWEKRNVYTEKPYPLIGNLAIGREGLGYTIVRIYKTLDDKCPYFGVYMFHKPVFVAKDKELIKRILVKDFSSFSNRVQYANEKVDAIASNNLFTFRNDVWKFVRNKLTPVFTSGKLKLMLPLMNDIVVNLEDVLNTTDNQNVDIKDICKRFTTDITTSCAFGLDSGILKNTNSEIKEMTDKLLNPKGFVRRFAAFCWLLCPFLIDILRLPFLDPEATEYLTNVFKHSEDERKKNNVKRNDFVDLMMELSEQEMENDLYKFDDLKKSAQAMVFYNAGTESTSTTLSVCLYELALNPDVQEKLRHEIKQNLDSQGNISYEKLHGMEYLDLVIKETLRKYPFAQFLSRYADNDYHFEPTGLVIEKGTQVIIPVMALHHDQKYYPNPSKFDPERFRGDKIKELQYVYCPFGEGPRKCIGERFAIMAIKLAVASFLKKYELIPGEKTDIPLKIVKNSFFIATEDGTINLKIKRID